MIRRLNRASRGPPQQNTRRLQIARDSSLLSFRVRLRVSRNSEIYANASSIYDVAEHLRLVIVRRTRLPSEEERSRKRNERRKTR